MVTGDRGEGGRVKNASQVLGRAAGTRWSLVSATSGVQTGAVELGTYSSGGVGSPLRSRTQGITGMLLRQSQN